jgi:uncharacterized membrane protein
MAVQLPSQPVAERGEQVRRLNGVSQFFGNGGRMMIFVESPWPILFTGVAVEAVLAILLLRTGLGKFLIAMIVVAVLVAAGLVGEHFAITDRKLVAQTLDAAVAAVRRNDLQGTLACVSPSAKEARDLASWVFARVKFEEAYISGLEVKVNHLTSPPSAEADFRAMGMARDRRGEIPYESFARHVTLTLRMEGGRWLVTGYKIEGVDK